MAKYKIIPSSRTIVQSPISIGHKAEKGVEAIEFDLTAWVETYGSGTLTVIMRRWGDAIPYPIALEIDENNKATWTLSDTDTAKAGMAYAQLNYIVGDEVVKKSDIYTFRVMDSLTGEGEPPEAYESWLEHLTHLAAEAMAEVLDIEGIVTDKTLTVDGGIADAKATGDALSALEDAVTEETDKLKADLGAYSNKAIKSLSFSDGTPSGDYSIVFPTFVQGGISISGGTIIKYTESARDIRTETPISGGYLIHNLDTGNNNIRIYIFVNGTYSSYMRDVQWNNIMSGEWVYLPIISGYTYQICFHTTGSSITPENAPIEMLRIAKSENPLNDVVPGYAWNATEGTAANSKRAYMIFPGVKKGDVIKFNGERYSVNYYVLGGNLTDLFYTPNAWDSTGEIKVNVPDDKSYQLFIQFKWSDNNTITADRAAYISNFTQIITDLKTVDLFIFMGQSNMAGRGVTNSTWTEKAQKINFGAGYEFRAISDPTKLYPALEPFGVDENQTGGIDDTTPDNDDLTTGVSKKTGSCVVALMNAYFGVTGIPIVGVSASEGGTTIAQWQPNTDRLNDALNRLTTAVTWLEANGYYIRHKYMMWCQGENDASTPSADYKSAFSAMFGAMKTAGIEKCFLARIGEYNSGISTAYSAMIQCQTEIGQEMEDVIMCTTDLASFRDRGLMKDKYHFYQAAYNEMGRYSGANIAFYVETGKEPTMYDSKYNNLYYSHKN
jgi:hypothetical protein